jgi:hypothetical protein
MPKSHLHDFDEGPSDDDLARFGSDDTLCPDCGARVWDQADICPKCFAFVGDGHARRSPIQQYMHQKMMLLIIIILLIAMMVVYVL